MATKRTVRKSSPKPQTRTANRDYDVRYVPDFVLKQISGAKGDKGGRPELFSLRTYKVRTKDGETVIGSYLVFGGVPPQKLHEKLEGLGFKLRRRPASWTDKQNVVHEVGDNDRDCYAVYYNTEKAVTPEQAEYIGGLLAKTTNFVAEKGQTFLLPTWDAVDADWGNRDNWLQICTVAEEENSPTSGGNGDDEDAPGVDLTALDDMF